jgi:hypothetical protein
MRAAGTASVFAGDPPKSPVTANKRMELSEATGD